MKIVIAGTTREFEEYCMENRLDRSTAIEIRQPSQLDLYPHLPIEFTGTFWLNEAYYAAKDRLKAQVVAEGSNVMRFGNDHQGYSQEFESFWSRYAWEIGKLGDRKALANFVWEKRNEDRGR